MPERVIGGRLRSDEDCFTQLSASSDEFHESPKVYAQPPYELIVKAISQLSYALGLDENIRIVDKQV